MPIADKDLQLRAGARTTFGSRAFGDFIAAENDEVVDACETAGTVSLGKTASPEFGFAGYMSSLLHGHTTVPGHPGLGAGGSSGGAAAAVAARLLPFAPGSDAFQTAWHASAAAMSPTDEQLELFEPLTAHFVRSGRSMPHGDGAAAQKRLDEFGSRIRDAFAPYDAVVTHTTALTPRPVGWFTDDPEVNFRRQCEYAPHTSFVNLAGLPAVSLPLTDLPDGLTMSVQIIGRHAEDRLVVATAAQLERMSQ